MQESPIVFHLKAVLSSMDSVMLCRSAENVTDRVTGEETQFGCEVRNTNGGFCQNQEIALFPWLRFSRCCTQILQT